MLTFAIFYSFGSYLFSWGNRKGADISSHQFVFGGGGVGWGGWVVLRTSSFGIAMNTVSSSLSRSSVVITARTLPKELSRAPATRLLFVQPSWKTLRCLTCGPDDFYTQNISPQEKEQNTNVWTVASGGDPASNWVIYKTPMACPRSHLSSVYKLHFSL